MVSPPHACQSRWELGLFSALGLLPPTGPALWHLLMQLAGRSMLRGWGPRADSHPPFLPSGRQTVEARLACQTASAESTRGAKKRHLSLIRGFYVNTTAILEPGAWLAPEPRCRFQPSQAIVPAQLWREQGECLRTWLLPQPGAQGPSRGLETRPLGKAHVWRTGPGGF